MRYVVFGAGAIGGTIGAKLVERGHDVVFIARGAHHDALVARGLEFRSPEKREWWRVGLYAGFCRGRQPRRG